MITDRIGRHEVLLPGAHQIDGLLIRLIFLIKTQETPRFFLLAVKKKAI